MTITKKTVWVVDGNEFTDRKSANSHGRVAELIGIIKEASSPEEAVNAILSTYRVLKNTGVKRPRKVKEAVAAVHEAPAPTEKVAKPEKVKQAA